jgi:hypothetical protein
MRLRFRFRTIPFLATLLLVLLGIALGNWQTRRAAEKTGAAGQARTGHGRAAAACSTAAPSIPRAWNSTACRDGRIRPQLAAVPRQPAAGRPQRIHPADAV